ncbi:carbohydrate esterase family 1 protein [Rhodotorula graminis WP1]|uniref:S-formylglutathione hydrolase n=1 Tax=Rhodotorula graminis (strain WP1) TaxID=578459 RepID=A0A0P9ITE0_RHOGW|nr:carbohydrate esterase family 1 protein [Rhodotorula graminis WP1]KPV72662.1 carbohydrate esterase family 1 protein [Rhodotorula graminis WP1]
MSSTTAPEKLSTNASFDGELVKLSAPANSLGGLKTTFNVFLPRQALDGDKVPVLYYLAGLTCNEDTAPWKGGFLRDAAAEGIALVFPDTSPRGADIDGEDKDWDFGTGAGFYLTASKEPWKKHYNMYEFITSELPSLLAAASLPLDLSRSSIFGHSMGGHGALTLYLKSLLSTSPSTKYLSASAFAPIANPTQCPWGDKAFKGYLAGGLDEGKQYDATELVGQLKGKDGVDLKVLVDVGTGDQFYQQKQLLPENLIAARDAAGFSASQLAVNLHERYDHSYYFISTFAPAHIKFHAEVLKAAK